MAIKTTLNYSPNFDPKKRKTNQIKFLILHYTGMKTEKAAINRLTDIESRVSAHYLIKQNGEIITLVPDLYTAWHAGKSVWKNYTSLNKDSIGIEIVNPGHDINYKKFSKIQLAALVRLSKFLIKKYRINLKNILGHSDIAPERKKDPGEKFPWKLLSKKKIGYWHNLNQNELIKNRNLKTSSKEKNLFLTNLFKIGYQKKFLYNSNFNRISFDQIISKAFQRRFRPEIINGKIDQECLLISQNLVKK
ncbi:N-acetylmuramoyl-L-alanine amidase [Candidatus Pelagibacter sp.]|jgi:N-acetylmuramoyl-L-alanine amidase|nr:N-acetylmuramoyl-L-alanine amidase [Candidatus Pelagibacter sp.]